MGHREPRMQGPGWVPCAVRTTRDSRDEPTARRGAYSRRALRRAGHPIVASRIVKDDPRRIVSHLRLLATEARARAALLTGGTGLGRRDSTFEAVDGLLDKRLEGFGELFRALSYKRIGPAAMLSRATAGLFRGLLV